MKKVCSAELNMRCEKYGKKMQNSNSKPFLSLEKNCAQMRLKLAEVIFSLNT